MERRLATLAISAVTLVFLLLAGTVASSGHVDIAPTFALAADEIGYQDAGLPAFSHVFLVVLENKDFEQVYGSVSAPYLNGLAVDYGVARGYFAVGHPSLPNYLALLSGDTFGVMSDCRACYQSAPSLATQLESQGRSWRAYFESMPSPCFNGDSPDGLYVQKHNPFIYFDDIRLNSARCRQIVPLSQFTTDLANDDLPDLVWIGPNSRSSTHDAPLAEGDRWLAGVIPTLLESSPFQGGGLLAVTFDEGRDPGQNRVMTVLASPYSRRGYTSSSRYDHFSLLRTIEDAWGLSHIGHAADPSTRSLAEFFASQGPA